MAVRFAEDEVQVGDVQVDVDHAEHALPTLTLGVAERFEDSRRVILLAVRIVGRRRQSEGVGENDSRVQAGADDVANFDKQVVRKISNRNDRDGRRSGHALTIESLPQLPQITW